MKGGYRKSWGIIAAPSWVILLPIKKGSTRHEARAAKERGRFLIQGKPKKETISIYMMPERA